MLQAPAGAPTACIAVLTPTPTAAAAVGPGSAASPGLVPRTKVVLVKAARFSIYLAEFLWVSLQGPRPAMHLLCTALRV